MQNQEIIKIIENLKGRRNYEEKKASKLGFNSLYEYFEFKVHKEQIQLEEKTKKFNERSIKKKSKQKQESELSKNCKCC